MQCCSVLLCTADFFLPNFVLTDEDLSQVTPSMATVYEKSGATATSRLTAIHDCTTATTATTATATHGSGAIVSRESGGQPPPFARVTESHGPLLL
jgi:hypothetical protein